MKIHKDFRFDPYVNELHHRIVRWDYGSLHRLDNAVHR